MKRTKWFGLAVVVLGLSGMVAACGTLLPNPDFTTESISGDHTVAASLVPLNRPPTGNQRLTQPFGGGWCEGTGSNRVCYSGHLGEDYGPVVAGRAGDPVYAIRAGRVVLTGDNRTSGYGVYVVIRHEYPSRPLYSIYGHLNSRSVNRGDEVAEGQQIGTMGTTGFSTAVHLHIGILDRETTGAGYRCNRARDLSCNFNGDQITHNGITYFRPSLFFTSPTLRIDGGIRSTKPQGQTFHFTGSGYTPNGTVTRSMRLPNGTEITLTPKLRADASGNIRWSFTSSCANPVGTYILWAIDDTTGRGFNWSNEVYEIITRGPSCR
jgi:murein DD-endopeptidase MepM/ murein hydrolase activator NlpD